MTPIPYIEAKGNNYDIGYAIGNNLKERIQVYRDNVKVLYSNIDNSSKYKIENLIDKIRTFIYSYFPLYLEEIKGIADGAGITLREAILISNEETIFQTLKDKCTTLAFSCEDGVLLGHNEDWSPGYEDKMYVIKAKPKKKPSFLSLAYIGSLPGSSATLNSYGIAFSGNSLLSGVQDGVPKKIILRSQIEAETLKEFEKLASFSPRAIPNHTMAIDKKGNIVSVELSISKKSHVYPSNHYIHTNHPIHESMLMLEKKHRQSSIVRLNTANEFLKERELSTKLMEELLKSHRPKENSICIHAKTEDYDDCQTIASVVVNISEMSMAVAKGNPCKSEYKKYFL